MSTDYDLLIIGGGVNGAGIARDAAGRGMSVLLVEAGDLAGATSSASTKLIHGGLRYLEYYEFRLVREALREREVLLGLAPHIIWPLDFILPHVPGVRPAWMVRIGLYLYDHLGKLKRLKPSKGIDLGLDPSGRPLKDSYKKGFQYSDCWVQDSRLVVLNALDASELGAHILTRTACTGLKAVDGHWQAELRDVNNGETLTRTATMVVNAAGPWVHKVLEGNNLIHQGKTHNIRLVKGSHIIVPRIFEGPQAYILQQPDRRIVFAIPYEYNYTLIGTTEVDYHDDPTAPKIGDAEKEYLCSAVNRYFKTTLAPAGIVHTYSGVRPLLDDGKGAAREVTRDYTLELETHYGAPILSVFGGKITTYRRLAEETIGKLMPYWTRAHENPASQSPWTDTVPLPGGDMLNADFDGFLADQAERYDWLPPDLLLRYARAYGTRMDRMLKAATDMNSLGRHFGDGIYLIEIEYLRKFEWAKTAEDILWRRSKMLLHISDMTRRSVEAYMDQ
ncbi:MAG: Aerobic glycerol-3-phosphate dehydrogenase [Micavibrio sp.]|nr:Aerobic glycerol-3-phosphate dehydrogenase [Micavibrio sp.]